jgi:hypothetical protein
MSTLLRTIAVDSDPSLTRGTYVVELTDEAFLKLRYIDQQFVGTWNYMGLAYFWAHDYRHDLRDAPAVVRCRIHDAFLSAGLPLNGASAQHRQLIDSVIL